MPDPTDFAIVLNEPTPYRLHLLGRMARELEGARLHSVFTHRLHDASEPWRMQAEADIRPVFFEQHALGNAGAKNVLIPFSRERRLFRDIAAYITEHRIRMIVMHGYNDLTRLMLIRWARRKGIPVVLRGDSNIFGEGRVPPVRRLIKRLYLRWLLRQVAGLMPMGTCGRAYFRMWDDHRLPTFLCPYEPDYAAIQACDTATRDAFMHAHHLLPDRKRLLYCGRLVPVKRVDVLIDAFARVAADRPEWDVVIAGDGALRQSLEQRVPPALRERVKFVGFLQFDQTVACYHSCHALAHPSEFEPWALVINEAVAAGLAVIATEVTGAAVELVGHRHNGLIVPPGDVDAMAAAISELTEGDTCERMRSNAGEMLSRWRRAADPVDGVRQALRHFH